MLIEIIGGLPVESDITSFFEISFWYTKCYQYYETNVAFFLIIARTSDRISLNMFGSRFLVLYCKWYFISSVD